MDQTKNPAADQMLVTGLFNDRPSAERAYDSVTARGYAKNDVNLVMSDETRKRHFTTCWRGCKGASIWG